MTYLYLKVSSKIDTLSWYSVKVLILIKTCDMNYGLKQQLNQLRVQQLSLVFSCLSAQKCLLEKRSGVVSMMNIQKRSESWIQCGEGSNEQKW